MGTQPTIRTTRIDGIRREITIGAYCTAAVLLALAASAAGPAAAAVGLTGVTTATVTVLIRRVVRGDRGLAGLAVMAAALCTATLCVASVPPWWALLAVALAAAALWQLYRWAGKARHWAEWNDFVAAGGDVYKVSKVDTAYPFRVDVVALERHATPHLTVTAHTEPQFAAGDYVSLTGTGRIAAWVPADVAEHGLKEARK